MILYCKKCKENTKHYLIDYKIKKLWFCEECLTEREE